VDPAHTAIRRISRPFEKEERVFGNTEPETETRNETQDERIVGLVSSGASQVDEGVVVWVHACEEPWTPDTGMRLTEDDAWELSDALREAARLVAGSEPQAFIQLFLKDHSR
jgi:hypothetical protein